ncbi:apolipoprotein N-acyltransferase [Nocardiopsis mwathae]|uniref:Apolipoprotein N-acyltransferase n=1 Tax=Nocardiopsis mwathae TaxID=1472723 RepID=A0A7W9YJL3_9ACTN|nr:SPW repeat protein [Nocardiopsis mwathae]MBB6173264.1 apolipoprotein N-acyltransferase [Nocardiopsis mwathae]
MRLPVRLPKKIEGRWEDWVAVAAGVAAAVSWVWHGMVGAPMLALYLLGLFTLLAAVMAITRPGLIATEGIMVGLGVLMFLSPWLVGFTDVAAGAWTAWILGFVIAAIGVVDLPLATAAHRREPRPQPPPGGVHFPRT